MQEQSNRDDLAPDQGAFSRYMEVIKLAAPATASMLSYNLVGLVDTLMVGSLGAPSLGGVGLANALLFTVGALLMGTMGAVAPLTAQNEGAGNRAQAGRFVHQAVWVALSVGLVLGLSLSLGASTWLGLLKPGQAVAAAGGEYLSWRALGLPVVMAFVAYDHLLQGLGDTRTPMRISLVSNALNALLTFWWVGGGLGVEAMGVAGAAKATLVSQLLTVVLYQRVIHSLNTRRPEYGLWPLQRPSLAVLRQLLALGLPMGVQFALDVAAWLTLSTFAGWISDEALAASQIVGRLVGLPLMMAHGITVAATSLVGRQLGAGNVRQARLQGDAAMVSGLLLTALVAATAAAWPVLWVGMFTSEEAIVALSAKLLLVSVALMMAETLANGAYGVLQGAGDTRFTLKVTAGVTWALGVPLAWLLAFNTALGVTGIYVALGVQMAVISAFYLVRLRGERWLSQRLVEADPPLVAIGAKAADVKLVPLGS